MDNIKNCIFFMFAIPVVFAFSGCRETKLKEGFYKIISSLDTNSYDRLWISSEDSKFQKDIKDIKEINKFIKLLKFTSTNNYGRLGDEKYHVKLSGKNSKDLEFIVYVNPFSTLLFLENNEGYPSSPNACLGNNYLKDYIIELQKHQQNKINTN